MYINRYEYKLYTTINNKDDNNTKLIKYYNQQNFKRIKILYQFQFKLSNRKLYCFKHFLIKH